MANLNRRRVVSFTSDEFEYDYLFNSDPYVTDDFIHYMEDYVNGLLCAKMRLSIEDVLCAYGLELGLQKEGMLYESPSRLEIDIQKSVLLPNTYFMVIDYI